MTSIEPNEMYSVQLNAYVDKHYAELFLLSMKSKGYRPYMITFQGDKTWYKILIGPYPSKAKAVQVAQTLKEKEKLKAIIIPAINPSVENDQTKPTNNTKVNPKTPKSSIVASTKPSALPESKEKKSPKRSSPKPPPKAQLGNAPGYDSTDVVASLFLAWVKSWQGRDADSYLSFYSSDFSYSGNSLEEWKKARRSTLAKSVGIKIDFSDIQIVQGKDTVVITFIQEYHSDNHSDKGQKTLTWKREGEAWRIIKEIWIAV